jgi:tetratricopeptide (TPR) repeat protein
LDESVEALNVYREVLASEPTNETALSALDRMVAGDVETFEVSQILEPIYREQAWWDRLLNLHETRIRHEDSGDERYRLWLECADIHEQQNNTADALVSVGNALSERPSDEALRVRLESLADKESLWADAAAVYRRLLREDLGDAEALDTCVRMARILDARLQDVEAAEAAWRRALEIEPSTEEALRALDRIFTGQERWDDVSENLVRMREVVYDPAEAVPLAQQVPELAQLAGQMLLFGVRGFPVGREMETVFETALEQLQQAAGQPKPQQENPEVVKAQADMQVKQAEIQQRAQADGQKMQLEQAKAQMQAQIEAQKLELEKARLFLDEQKLALENQRAQTDANNADAERAMKSRGMDMEARERNVERDYSEIQALSGALAQVQAGLDHVAQMSERAMQVASAPRRVTIERGPDGRAIGARQEVEGMA